jgi:transcriptional regulator with XRE-family HTH domain
MHRDPPADLLLLEYYKIELKLRALRAQRRLTLMQLAAATGLSTAMLSKLESGQMIPTLRTLSKICRVYGVSLGYFFSDSARHSMSITRKSHMDASRSAHEVVRQIPLRCGTTSHLNAAVLEFPGKLLAAASDPGQGLACILYVVEGKLQLDVGGMREVLEAGDCACLDTDMVVLWGSAVRDAICRVLYVNTARTAVEADLTAS